jgi:hypothetical protein
MRISIRQPYAEMTRGREAHRVKVDNNRLSFHASVEAIELPDVRCLAGPVEHLHRTGRRDGAPAHDPAVEYRSRPTLASR